MNGSQIAAIVLFMILVVVVSIASGLLTLGYTPTVGVGS